VNDVQFPRPPANGCRRCGRDFASLESFDAHWRLWPGHGRNELLPFDDEELRIAGFAEDSRGRLGDSRSCSPDAFVGAGPNYQARRGIW
jgi:hypothetical protein